jgi:hypothetical protein
MKFAVGPITDNLRLKKNGRHDVEFNCAAIVVTQFESLLLASF